MNGQAFYTNTANAIAGYLRQELNIQPGVHYRFAEATSGPRVLALMLIVNPRYAPKITALAEQMSMAAGLDRGQSIRVDRGRQGMLALEIPKPGGIDEHGRPYGLWYNVSVASLPRRRFLLASVGFTGEFRPAAVNFASPMTPHCLIAGMTGSGKTNVQRLIIYDLAAQNAPDAVQFILIDTRKRGSAWAPFAGLPHLLHPIITDDMTAGRALSWAVAEIDRRSAQHRDSPRVFIGIDEAQVLLEQEALVRSIVDIARTGREFGIHLVAVTQNPTAKQLGDATLKRNLSVRLVGRVDDATAAHIATGQEGSDAHRLTGAGDMLLVTPDGMDRITAALVTDHDTGELPRAAAVGALDLSQYEDSDHVADVADLPGKAGRHPDPFDFYLVGRLLAHLAKSPNLVDGSLANKLGVYAGKVTRHREVAGEVLRGLRDEVAVMVK